MTYDPAVTRIGDTLYVDSVNGKDATAERGTIGLKYKTIQAALNAASDGDTIICTGSFTENLTIPATLSRLALQSLGFENTVLTGNISWSPTTGTSQIVYVSDLFIIGNVTYDSTGKTGASQSFMRFKQCRMFGDWNATGLGLGNDFFQIANCSFGTGTFTHDACTAQISSLAPDNSFITTWTQTASAGTSDSRPLGIIVTSITMGSNCQIVAYSTQFTNITFSGTVGRFLGCDIYGTVTVSSGYIDVRESQIAGATLTGAGEVDRKVVSIPVTTPGDGSLNNVISISPPLGSPDYGIMQTPQTAATTITDVLIHDLAFNQFQYEDTGSVQDINFIIVRGVS